MEQPKLEEFDTESIQSEREPFWTPQTFANKTDELTRLITKFASYTSHIDMAREQESNGTAMMQMILEMRAKDRKAEQRRVESEEARKEEDLRREERMKLAL